MQGPFSTQEKAARESAKHLKQKVGDLRKAAPRPVESPVALYRKITYIKIGPPESHGWSGQTDVPGQGKFYTKVFKSQEDAAWRVAKKEGKPLSHYLIEDPRPSRDEMLARQQAIVKIYGKFAREGPEDWRKTLEHAKLSQSMYESEPVTEYASILFKYGPWKDFLLQAWKSPSVSGLRSQVQGPDAGEQALTHRAEMLWKLFAETMKKGAGHADLFKAHVDNVGFHTSHFASLSVILQH